jgi:hypothetical protein
MPKDSILVSAKSICNGLSNSPSTFFFSTRENTGIGWISDGKDEAEIVGENEFFGDSVVLCGVGNDSALAVLCGEGEGIAGDIAVPLHPLKVRIAIMNIKKKRFMGLLQH